MGERAIELSKADCWENCFMYAGEKWRVRTRPYGWRGGSHLTVIAARVGDIQSEVAVHVLRPVTQLYSAAQPSADLAAFCHRRES